MPKTAEILTIGLWQEAIFADYAVPAARVKAAEKLWAVGIVSREDQHGQEYSYETPGWQHACETEAEARDWAEKLLHSWDGGTWITSVQLNHGSKLVETIVRPLVKCGDYVAPSGNAARKELNKRLEELKKMEIGPWDEESPTK